MADEYSQELQMAISVAKRVGDMILFPSFGKATGVQQKADGSLVSDQDKLASEAAITALKQAFPYGIVEEETLLDERTPSGLWWTIDPLDGSREFIQGTGNDYSVLIGLCSGYTPVMGVAYKPHHQELFWAIKGRGAFLQRKDGSSQRLQVSAAADKTVITSLSRNGAISELVVQLLGGQRIAMGGSAKFLEIAKGKATLGYQPPENRMYLWDIAPVYLIVREAGGLYTTASGGEISFDGPLQYHQGIAVANTKELHAQLVEAHLMVRKAVLKSGDSDDLALYH